MLFDLFAAVARQRARRGTESRERIQAALAEGYFRATRALLNDPRVYGARTEEELYRAGGTIVQALIFVLGDDGQGTPLLRIANKKTFSERLLAWFRSL
ncbi:MAG: hypothetical protein ACR2G5_15800 [Pyrinomonadaceae bacterium]